MKILFLDIDGVLNSRRSNAALDGYPQNFSEYDMAKFDLVAVALVRRLCQKTSCQIVLSSSWRYYFTSAEVASALDLPVIDCTTTAGYNDYARRGDEIKAWLASHADVTHYAIVDDINAMLPEQQPHFVQTDRDCGLLLNDYYQLYLILGDDEGSICDEIDPDSALQGPP